MKKVILIVDDDKRNLLLMEAMLMPFDYDVILARDGEEALEKVQERHPDLVLLDALIPKINGFEVTARLKKNEETKIIPIVLVTALREVEDRVKGMEVGADDFISKPVEKTELRARVKSLLKVKAYNDRMRIYQRELETDVSRKTRQLKQASEKIKAISLETIYRLSRAAEYKDLETAAHIQRMSHYSVALARKMDLDEKTTEAIQYAAPMHDIGKIGIPDQILLKPSKLEPEEWEMMKRHTLIGGRILEGSDAKLLKLAEIISLTHHERWDNNGYPRRLKGSTIPLAGRITAIADVFDALTSRRPYRKESFSLDKTFTIIQEGRGSHFDPDVVDAFFSIQDEILSIKKRIKDGHESLH